MREAVSSAAVRIQRLSARINECEMSADDIARLSTLNTTEQKQIRIETVSVCESCHTQGSKGSASSVAMQQQGNTYTYL